MQRLTGEEGGGEGGSVNRTQLIGYGCHDEGPRKGTMCQVQWLRIKIRLWRLLGVEVVFRCTTTEVNLVEGFLGSWESN